MTVTRAPRTTLGRFLPGTHWRPRRPHWDFYWLVIEYLGKQRSMADIAAEAGCTEVAIRHWLRKHGIPRRTTSEARAIKYWGLHGAANPMFGRTGAANPNWTGGQDARMGPEMQAWRRRVLARDWYLCRLCHDTHRLEVHHILPFGQFPETRTTDSNGITLCHCCHAKLRGRELEFFPVLSAIVGVRLAVYVLEGVQ